MMHLFWIVVLCISALFQFISAYTLREFESFMFGIVILGYVNATYERDKLRIDLEEFDGKAKDCN